jgi:hypothetical protein
MGTSHVIYRKQLLETTTAHEVTSECAWNHRDGGNTHETSWSYQHGILLLLLGAVAPTHAQQEQHEQDAKHPKQEEQAKPEKQQQDQNKQQHAQQQVNRPSQQEQHGHEGEQRVAWQQRGGYNGFRIPEDRYREDFGPDHAFRIYSYPVVVVGGYPRFQYRGFCFSVIDPWPEYWSDDWYDNDDVYIDYSGDGYYMYNRRYPRDRIAITVFVSWRFIEGDNRMQPGSDGHTCQGCGTQQTSGVLTIRD